MAAEIILCGRREICLWLQNVVSVAAETGKLSLRHKTYLSMTAERVFCHYRKISLCLQKVGCKEKFAVAAKRFFCGCRKVSRWLQKDFYVAEDRLLYDFRIIFLGLQNNSFAAAERFICGCRKIFLWLQREFSVAV